MGNLSEAGLGLSVAHRIWQFTAMATTIHTYANKYFKQDQTDQAHKLQDRHVQWIRGGIDIGKPPDDNGGGALEHPMLRVRRYS